MLLKTPLPIECFVITNDYSLKDEILDGHSKKLENDLQVNKSSSIHSSLITTSSNSETRKKIIDSSKLKTDTLSSTSTNKSLDYDLISFNKYQINNFLEDDEIYKGGSPLHWCSDKR